MLQKITSIILAGIPSLAEYKAKLPQLDVCRTCPDCGLAAALHRHGNYGRKADRHAEPGKSLNLVKILRFMCRICRKTCSALPECIPPRRWYLWKAQQAVILAWLAGHSWNLISQKFKISRSTCRRWVQHLQSKFPLHSDVLKNTASGISQKLVYCFEVKPFWQTCLAHIDLSRAMLLCHRAGIYIP